MGRIFLTHHLSGLGRAPTSSDLTIEEGPPDFPISLRLGGWRRAKRLLLAASVASLTPGGGGALPDAGFSAHSFVHVSGLCAAVRAAVQARQRLRNPPLPPRPSLPRCVPLAPRGSPLASGVGRSTGRMAIGWGRASAVLGCDAPIAEGAEC